MRRSVSPTLCCLVLVLLLLFLTRTRNWSESDYPELRHPPSSIRLLHLQPGAGKSTIHVELKTYSLAQHPEFEALSYTWGDPKVEKSIRTDRKKMGAQKNLYEALAALRHPWEARVLWVDAICINQGNIEEKNSQIPLMTWVYSNAKNTLVWLGNHHGPRWADTADDLDWSSGWAVAHATRYPQAAKYWLYRMSEEEYWKRCWIIQEIGMSVNIQVYFGKRFMPWIVFVDLMEWYRREYRQADVHNILRLNTLRQNMYLDKTSFSLSQLLIRFHDSFCTVSLDRIFAFVGMANECRNGCLDVDYNKTPYEIYLDTITTLNMSFDAEINHIQMVSLASVIRQKFNQKSVLVPKRLKDFGKRADPSSYIYGACCDEKEIICSQDRSGDIASEAIFMDRLVGTIRWLRSLGFRKRRQYTHVYLPSTSEATESGLSDMLLHNEDTDIIQTRALIAGSVGYIGPSYSSFIGDFKIVKWWTSQVAFYTEILDQRKARGLNDRFMNLLGTSSYALLNHVKPIGPNHSTNADDGPKLFLGSPVMVGLLPSNAQHGDLIAQFWNSNAAAVLRNTTSGSLEVIGRALLVANLDSFDWDVPTDSASFYGNQANVINLGLSLKTLTILSLDSTSLGTRS